MKNNLPIKGKCNIETSEIQYLHYPGNGPNLVLLHATGFMPWIWHPIAKKLTESFNIYAPYFCDHRIADPHEGGLSWQILAHDFTLFCDKMKIKSAYMAGHSMGATVITLAAGSEEINPEKIILIEPIYLPDKVYDMRLSVEQHPLASKSIKRRNSWSNKSDAKAYLKSKSLFRNWDTEMLDIYLNHGIKENDDAKLSLCCSPQREASLFMGGGAKNPWPLLPKIKCPALIVEGEVSENSSYIDLIKATKKFTLGNYIKAEGAGHLVPMEKPIFIKKIIADFFLNNKIYPIDNLL